MTVPEGRLAVFSVDTEEEAEALLVLTCPRAKDNKSFIAPELAEEQTLENLTRFSDRLAKGWRMINGG